MSYFFTDMDETLVSIKTMFSFESFWIARNEGPGRESALTLQPLQSQLATLPRYQANREFYKRFKNRRVERVEAAVAEWYEAIGGCAVVQSHAYETLQQLREQGLEPVLVSGSFAEALAPFARDLRISDVIASVLERKAGSFTGALTHAPLIGHGKRSAVRRFLAHRGVAPETCAAMGDHTTDVSMLRSVGVAFVVGGNCEMEELAGQEGWQLVTQDDHDE